MFSCFSCGIFNPTKRKPKPVQYAFLCPQCNNILRLQSENAGVVECPKCWHVTVVQGPQSVTLFRVDVKTMDRGQPVLTARTTTTKVGWNAQ